MSSPIPISPRANSSTSHAQSSRGSLDDHRPGSKPALSRKTSNLTVPSASQTPRLSSSPRFPASYVHGTGLRRPPSIAPSTPAGANVDLDELTDEEKAKVLRRHLVSRAERNRDDAGQLASSPTDSVAFPQARDTFEPENEELFPIPFDTPGGDTTHPIYKWNSSVSDSARQRSISFAGK
jgi:solute carrier family 36 (proton-coupled amino acid transporter)